MKVLEMKLCMDNDYLVLLSFNGRRRDLFGIYRIDTKGFVLNPENPVDLILVLVFSALLR